MATEESSTAGDSASAQAAPSITANPNGPYTVRGGVPLYRRHGVDSDYGEPLA